MTSLASTPTANRPVLSKDGHTLTVRVPVSFRKQGGRKQIVTPTDADPWLPPARTDEALIKAIVRAHRWREMLEGGQFGSIRELAKSEKENESYVCRILRLTLLSPALVTILIDGKQPAGLRLLDLLAPQPADWDSQQRRLNT